MLKICWKQWIHFSVHFNYSETSVSGQWLHRRETELNSHSHIHFYVPPLTKFNVTFHCVHTIYVYIYRVFENCNIISWIFSSWNTNSESFSMKNFTDQIKKRKSRKKRKKKKLLATWLKLLLNANSVIHLVVSLRMNRI